MFSRCMDPTAKKFRRKRGIGIMEIVVAAMVLGILYMGVSNLQKGNREALLRIRGRDGAITVAQNIIDSLGSLGLANFTDEALPKDDVGDIRWTLDTINTRRIWLGQPGLLQDTMKVDYFAVVTISPDSVYKAKATSLLRPDSISHVFAKRLDVKVGWYFKGSEQSISVSGVIR